MKYTIRTGFYLMAVLCCFFAFVFLGAAVTSFLGGLSTPVLWLGTGASGTIVGGLSLIIATNLAKEDGDDA